MRGRFLAIGLIFGAAISLQIGPAQALLEAQQQATPPSGTQPDAPQPQKKPVDKKAGKTAQADTSSSQSSTAEQNPFPEAVSQKAADQEEGASQDKADPSAPSSKSSAAEENPFPEGQSEKAAQKSAPESGSGTGPESGPGTAAGSPPGADNAAPPVPLPPGVSSSQSSSLADTGEVPKPGQVTDAARAREDTRVGDFYFAEENWKGANQRYQDATIYDPTNVDAIFGLAQTYLKLKQYAQAQSNYMLYLSIVPNGPKAKQSLKALKSMAEKK